MENHNKAFSLSGDVKPRKNQALKVRTESAISSCGLSNKDFYEKVGITRQQWYWWSWGLIEFPEWLKVKLCDTFGKPFIDLFLSIRDRKLTPEEEEILNLARIKKESEVSPDESQALQSSDVELRE